MTATSITTEAGFAQALRDHPTRVTLGADVTLTANIGGIKPPAPCVVDLAGYRLSSTASTTGIVDFANLEFENGVLGRMCFAMGERLRFRDVAIRGTQYLRGALNDCQIDRYDVADCKGRAFMLDGRWGTQKHLVDNVSVRNGTGMRLGDDFAYAIGCGLVVFEHGRVSDISEVLYGPDGSVQHADCFQATGVRDLRIIDFDIARVLGWQGVIVHPNDGLHPQMNERLLLEDVTFTDVAGHDVMLISAGHCTLRRVVADKLSVFYTPERSDADYDPTTFVVELDDCTIGQIMTDSPTNKTPWTPGPTPLDVTAPTEVETLRARVAELEQQLTDMTSQRDGALADASMWQALANARADTLDHIRALVA